MVTEEMVSSYRERGFVHVPGVISREEALEFRAAALAYSGRQTDLSDGTIFNQYVNVWTRDEAMRRLTLHTNVSAAARALAGVDLRLWHDQILIKQPGVSKATEFHQDQPYWPHMDSPNPISCWIALGDVPVEAGCMTFLPGSQNLTDLPRQNLADQKSLMDIAPDLVWSERVTVPLKAGDCTFHHGRCAHMATPNVSDSPRVAHVVIFFDAAARYSGAGHVVTDPLAMAVGDPFDDAAFPAVGG
jgi:ectoine hydroxylase-related dioxygenase (phytanoyl-CoA dioxygenase family)